MDKERVDIDLIGYIFERRQSTIPLDSAKT
jgi:hypothetical protein